MSNFSVQSSWSPLYALGNTKAVVPWIGNHGLWSSMW